MNLDPQIREQVATATGQPQTNAPITKLKGDASSRSYFRVGTPPRSWVVMYMPPETAKKSEEASAAGAAPLELPFINVHRYLKALEVRVPEILRYDEPNGMMVLEDLSDQTFEAELKKQDKTTLYTQAVQLLARLRARAERHPDPECLAFTRSFEVPLYEWELHHFREYGLEAWSGKQPSSEERALLDEGFKRIAAQLAAAPKGFTHRDYQSRNIMVKNGELVVIDFQDALQGPRQYDLVALLRDSYVELERSFVDAMLDAYIIAFENETKERIEAKPFKAFFDLLTVQRKLKDAGRFEFIHRVKGNSGFLVSIPASLRYVKAALDVQPELTPMRRVIAKYVPELA